MSYTMGNPNERWEYLQKELEVVRRKVGKLTIPLKKEKLAVLSAQYDPKHRRKHAPQ